MANVTINWIKQNIEKLSAFGGQITKDNFEEYVQGEKTLQTTLTRKGQLGVEACERTEKFHILIPGVGWSDAWGYSDEMKKLGGE